MLHKPSVRRGRLALGALVGALAAAALAAPGGAEAAGFVSPHCGGATVAGAGSSFANPLQSAWNQLFHQVSQCGSAAPTVNYWSIGSGGGRATMGSHESGNNSGQRDYAATGSSGNVRFAGSDSAASSTQRSQIEQGLGIPGQIGTLHEVPIAIGSISIAVHLPSGCTVPSNAPEFYQPDANDNDHTGRIKVSNDKIERAFEGTLPSVNSLPAQVWGDLAPDIVSSGSSGTGSKTTTQCQNAPVIRVVRQDNSGTTGAFKTWLNLPAVKTTGSINWSDPTYTASPNTVWPVSNQTDAQNGIVRGNTNSGEASAVQQTDGSIGYVELADARNFGFTKTPSNTATDDFDPALGGDNTFWLPVSNGSGTYTEPSRTDVADSWKSTAPASSKGANCSNVTFTDTSQSGAPAGTLPAGTGGDPTLGNWDKVNGLNSSDVSGPPAGQGTYGLCIPTYALAFDDNAAVYNATDQRFCDAVAEEAKARTEKDYLEMILTSDGQNVAAASDYSPLPGTRDINGNAPANTMLGAAQTGVNAIGWNKAGTSLGGCPTNTPAAGGGTTTSGGGTTTTPPTGAPSNAFTVHAARSQSNGLISFTASFQSIGVAQIVANSTVPVGFKVEAAAKHKKKKSKAKPKPISYSKATVTVLAPGSYTITLKPSAAAKAALAKGATLKVNVTLVFTPTGGTSNVTHLTLTVKGHKPAPKKKGHKK